MPIDVAVVRRVRSALDQEFGDEHVERVFPAGTLETFLARQYDVLAARGAEAARTDVSNQVGNFLASYGAHDVRRTYEAALLRYLAWCSKSGLHPLCLEIHHARSYLASLQKAATYSSFVGKSLVAAAAFLSFMRRQHPWVRNPFPAVERPKQERAKRPLTPPSEKDAAAILEYTSGFEGAAISAMLERGLWSVELERLELSSGDFTTKRGQQIHKGQLPQTVRHRFALAGLSGARPFVRYTAQQITFRVFKCLEGLYERGLTSRRYSADDLWPYYAQTLLRQNVALDEIQTLLGMATAQATQSYLARIAL